MDELTDTELDTLRRLLARARAQAVRDLPRNIADRFDAAERAVELLRK